MHDQSIVKAKELKFLKSVYSFPSLRAIMTFHSMKMEEINKIIRDLWRSTYRGQGTNVCVCTEYIFAVDFIGGGEYWRLNSEIIFSLR